MTRKLRVVILEPYYGGSHAAFVDVLAAHSRHECTLVTLPARKWKWRMRGAAVWMVREGGEWLKMKPQPDVILCNDMLSVADLRALLPGGMRDVPIVCYFHENQLTYPLSDDDWRDYQHGMTHITSCLAADAVWFNSRYHFESFTSAATNLLAKMPDHVPAGLIDDIRAKSSVLYPPVTAPINDPIDDRPLGLTKSRAANESAMTILWSHRWEYDKNPEPFFRALFELDASGRSFHLVVTGEQFRAAPAIFADSWDRLRPHIRHAGFLPSHADYIAMIRTCDVVVSSAIQENFGIAVVEAILSGCQPLLPDRLAYPEIIPQDYHAICLYNSDDELSARLVRLADGLDRLDPACLRSLQAKMDRRFGRDAGINALDESMSKLVSLSR